MELSIGTEECLPATPMSGNPPGKKKTLIEVCLYRKESEELKVEVEDLEQEYHHEKEFYYDVDENNQFANRMFNKPVLEEATTEKKFSLIGHDHDETFAELGGAVFTVTAPLIATTQ